ncbi:hypothetical protein [Desulfovirgula thermocuniculi]|nr:hypothetical protein [Desulfovirgula thermocuniculi]
MQGGPRKFPRAFWPRHPATRVVPDKRKELSRRACRKFRQRKEVHSRA